MARGRLPILTTNKRNVAYLLVYFIYPRYLSEWRQIATSGPSEPWRNGDDFADYVAETEARRAASALEKSRRQATPVARKRAMVVTPPSSSSSTPCLD